MKSRRTSPRLKSKTKLRPPRRKDVLKTAPPVLRKGNQGGRTGSLGCRSGTEKRRARLRPRSSPPAAAPAGGIDFGNKGLPLIFLLVFLGGLALNLTPCIYPLIPITISYFGGQAEGKKGGAVLHSFVYVFGMAMTYSILGVIAAFTGSLFGVALTYPPVLVGIALIMLALSLSMFDVYEFRMPAFLNKAAGTSKKGYFGTFFMGLTVGIIAAPCIGPFVLGLLTYVGQQGQRLPWLLAVLRPGPRPGRAVPVPGDLLRQHQQDPALGRLDGLGAQDLRIHPGGHGRLLP